MVLKLAASNPFTPSQLAKKLGIELGEAEALIGTLLAHGYLREVRPESCAPCPFKRACGFSPLRGARVYELTEKGRRIIESEASP